MSAMISSVFFSYIVISKGDSVSIFIKPVFFKMLETGDTDQNNPWNNK